MRGSAVQIRYGPQHKNGRRTLIKIYRLTRDYLKDYITNLTPKDEMLLWIAGGVVIASILLAFFG